MLLSMFLSSHLLFWVVYLPLFNPFFLCQFPWFLRQISFLLTSLCGTACAVREWGWVRLGGEGGAGLFDSKQHVNKWFCESYTSEKVHRWKLYIALDNTSLHFAWYGQNPSIHELRTFWCDIYPITSCHKNLY